MPDVVFSVDQVRSMRDQAIPDHNRWHPDIPPAVTVRPGRSIRVECREWTDGQIGNNDSANDVRDVDLTHAHMLSGPIYAQAYLLLGAAPIEGRVSGVVDIPNACCSLYLPTAIFDFDIRPTASGPVRADRGSCAVSS